MIMHTFQWTITAETEECLNPQTRFSKTPGIEWHTSFATTQRVEIYTSMHSEDI